MKFDCGPDWVEEEQRLTNWHPFFALLPRMVASHDCRWMEVIERKGMRSRHRATHWIWEYRARRA